ncbi:MAG: long-chain fatty acid--CoA ligase [Deltaproteobacteria bacterium]|nr:long-chain fatty acid--CoA ligase [Deltaproteobacteria bacterium]
MGTQRHFDFSNQLYHSPYKSALLWYLVTDLKLEVEGKISLGRAFHRTARLLKNKTALMDKKNGVYQALTYGELEKCIEHFSLALLSCGFQKGDRIGLWLKNSKEWTMTDFGTLDTGGITVPLYFTLLPESAVQILKNAGVRYLVLEDENMLEKFLPLWKDCPSIEKIIIKQVNFGLPPDPRLMSFESFLKLGEESYKKFISELEDRRIHSSHEDVATFIYTSGTTGEPKGVMLTHRNLLSNALGVLSVTELNLNDITLSVLPLSHAFERIMGHYIPILGGMTVAYAESFDSLMKNFPEVGPSYCCAVPRMFEKIHEGVLKKLKDGPALSRKIFEWALKVGAEVNAFKDQHAKIPGSDKRLRHRPEDEANFVEPEVESPLLKLKWKIAKKLVYDPFKQKLGGRIKFFVSGGAPLRKEIFQFFRNLNIKVFEGYGLSETSPVIAFNYFNKCKGGTVGKLLPWVQVKLAEDGEICVKGPNVMKGYFNNPQATQEMFDSEGWLHTGDIGIFDEDNFLKITDRKKEILVLSNGKNVAPLPIEAHLTASTLISQAMVLGNNQKYVGAFIIPEWNELNRWVKAEKIEATDAELLLRHEKVLKLFDNIISEVNQKLSQYEQIKRYQLLPKEFTLEAGELTPTLKMKRKIIESKNQEAFQKIFL